VTGAIPITRIDMPSERTDAIRQAVRAAASLPVEGAGLSRRATHDDAPALRAFLSDPGVHAPIYSLPVPLNEATVRTFIEEHGRQAEAGEGLLFVREDAAGEVVGYSDIQVWSQWGAGELGGALHPVLQSQGAGARGAAASFDWMFETLGLELICETAAPDNVRTARLLDGLGFERMGEVTSTRPDGTTRASLVWEISRQAWRARHPS
jgi:RimJ/RimL family protein N-acetyltransferase